MLQRLCMTLYDDYSGPFYNNKLIFRPQRCMSPIHKAVENGESLDANLASAWDHYSINNQLNVCNYCLKLLQNFKEMFGEFNWFDN